MSTKAIGYKDNDGNYGFRFTEDGRIYLGNTADDIISVTGSVDVKGDLSASGDVYVDVIRRQSDSSTTTKIRLMDEEVRIHAGNANDEVLKVESGNVTIDGTLVLNQFITHNGDADTRINFTDDRIQFESGGITMLGLHQKSSAPHQVTVNNGNNNIDFVVNSNNNSNDPILRTDASTARVGIRKAAPAYELDVDGTIAATTLDISGDADIDGTLEADAITVNGSSLASVIAGTTVSNATTAAAATTVTVADESSDTSCNVLFTTAATGNLAPKSGTNLTFNSSTGLLTATKFSGDGSALTSIPGSVVSSIPAGSLASDCVETAKIKDVNVTQAKMAANSVDSAQYVDGSIDLVHLSADSVDGTKLVDNAVNSEHYTDGSIDNAHMAANSIDSAQYVDGSIDTVHLSDDAVTAAKIATAVAGSGLNGGGGTALSVDVSDFMASGASNRILTSTGAYSFKGNSDLTWNGASLTITKLTETTPAVIVDGGSDTDVDVIRVKQDGTQQYGWAIRYLGDNNGDLNQFCLTMDNQNQTDVDAILVDQDGQTKFTKDVVIGSTGNPNGWGLLEVVQPSNDSSNGIAIRNTSDGRSMRLWCDGNDIARIDSGGSGASALSLNNGGGYVGVGTADPKNHLHVQKNAVTNADHDTQYNIATFEGNEARVQILAQDGGTNAATLALTNAPASGNNKHWTISHQGPSNSTPNALEFRYLTNSDGDLDPSDGIIAMSVSTSGKVSFGGGSAKYSPVSIYTPSSPSYDDALSIYSSDDIWYIYANRISSSSTNVNLQFNADGTNYGYVDDGGSNDMTNFTGQHRCLPDSSTDFETLSGSVGKIVVSSGQYDNPNVADNVTINESIPTIKLSDATNQKSVFGVISNAEDPNQEDRTYNFGAFGTNRQKKNAEDVRLHINSLGEGGIWITNINGNIENGDYITTCEIPGYGMKQDDDLLHNYTVAKITQDCLFDLNSTTYECEEIQHDNQTYRAAFVGCTYHCG